MKISMTFGLLLATAALAVACGDDAETTTGATTATTSTGGTGGTGGSTTSGMGGEGGSTTSGMGGEGGTAMKTPCEAYCDTVMTNCSGDNAQYSNAEHCMASCAAFPEGMASDTTGNTVGCRAYHAGAAAMDAAVHCVHAGPGGDGACGANCDGYCSIALKACGDKYADEMTCKTACEGFTDEVAYSAKATTGDSLACRLYHLTVATVDPAVHCDHIMADSAPCM